MLLASLRAGRGTETGDGRRNASLFVRGLGDDPFLGGIRRRVTSTRVTVDKAYVVREKDDCAPAMIRRRRTAHGGRTAYPEEAGDWHEGGTAGAPRCPGVALRRLCANTVIVFDAIYGRVTPCLGRQVPAAAAPCSVRSPLHSCGAFAGEESMQRPQSERQA